MSKEDRGVSEFRETLSGNEGETQSRVKGEERRGRDFRNLNTSGEH